MSTTILQLTINSQAGRGYVPYLRRELRQAHGVMKTRVRELSLALVGDRRMSELHERFMGIRGPTDVLTFALETDGRGRTVGGEVVVCVPQARRRAGAKPEAVRRELLLYALHGLLHLSGFDDRTPAEFRTMHRMEDRILTKIGVGPVFEGNSEFPCS